VLPAEVVGGKSRISDEVDEVPDHGIAPVKCQRILEPDRVRDADIRKDGAAIIATIWCCGVWLSRIRCWIAYCPCQRHKLEDP